MRIGIIGDVHGHARELIDMIATLEDYGIDRLVLLGDLVDRGPQSRYALRLASSWQFQARDGSKRFYDIVKGNHEDAYARVFRNQPKPGRKDVTIPENSAFYDSLSTQDLNLMHSLPVAIEIPEIGFTCIHGGVEPATTDLYDPWNIRTRYLDEKTRRSLPGTRSSKLWWASAYDGRFGTIVCGHESHREPTRYKHAIAIDGEGFNRLHGIVVSDEKGESDVTAFTCVYGETTKPAKIAAGSKAVRLHSWSALDDYDDRRWTSVSRQNERKGFRSRYPSYPRFGESDQRTLW